MKRLWIGVVLLSVMLAASIGLMLLSHHFYHDFSSSLEAAADAAMAENWTEATRKADDAAQKWQQRRRFLAAFTDHEPVEEIEQLLSRLALFQTARLQVDFADACRSLAHLCEAINESHNLKWWSVL